MRANRLQVVLAATLGLTTAMVTAGAAVANAAEDERVSQPPVEFSGHIGCGPPVGRRISAETSVEAGEDLTLIRVRGGAWRQTAVNLTDPRLEGDWYHTWESDAYRSADGESGPTVQVSTWRIEGEDGAWQGGQIDGTFADGTPLPASTVLVGEGAYEGITAFIKVTAVEGACAVDARGVIFDGAPLLEPYVPAE